MCLFPHHLAHEIGQIFDGVGFAQGPLKPVKLVIFQNRVNTISRIDDRLNLGVYVEELRYRGNAAHAPLYGEV